jgi:GNAT superfamily N-acetyltransferase
MPLAYRKLLPGELPEYAAHLLRLDAADRAARFHAGVHDDSIRAHMQRLSWPGTRVVGAFVDGALRGAVELQGLDMRTAEAELAVSVERGWQDRGCGTELVRRTLTVARNRGIREVTMLHLADNRRMSAIARRLGGVTVLGHGEVETGFALAPPDPVSILQELSDEGVAVIAAGLDLWRRLLAA